MSRSNKEFLLFEFRENLINVLVVAQLDHNFQLLTLDIWWVVVFAEKHTDIVLKNVGAFLKDQVDVAERDVLNLGRRCKKRHYVFVRQESRH